MHQYGDLSSLWSRQLETTCFPFPSAQGQTYSLSLGVYNDGSSVLLQIMEKIHRKHPSLTRRQKVISICISDTSLLKTGEVEMLLYSCCLTSDNSSTYKMCQMNHGFVCKRGFLLLSSPSLNTHRNYWIGFVPCREKGRSADVHSFPRNLVNIS